MRLIRCHIINFGGLSDFTLNFDDGLTVIHEENGFGKTTLAEFIRAMFYGFPKKGSHKLAKNARKKYLPWNGKRYGGYLIFEHEGKTYRIDRVFGSTKAKDEFRLSEGNNQRLSRDFTENIGEELFQLDADSFERSTYMPQVCGFDSMTTDSIQAKLGDLVDDTSDINNFDKALKALREKRSGYRAFRGEGGSISRTQTEISELQEELAQLKDVPDNLLAAKQERKYLEEQKSVHEGALTRIRQQITEASRAEATRTIQENYKTLQERAKQAEEEVREQRKKLPEKLPTKEEVDALMPAWDAVAALQQPKEEAEERQTAQETLAQLGDTFVKRVPPAEEIEEYDLKQTEYVSSFSAEQGMKLLKQEEIQLRELRKLFSTGVPAQKTIDAGKEDANRLRELETQAALEKLSAADECQLHELEAFFAPGVPSAEELEQKRRAGSTIADLQQENIRLTTAQEQKKQEEIPAERKKNAYLPLALSVLALIVGVILLAKKLYIPGGALTAAGVVLLLVGLAMFIKQTVKSEMASGQEAPMLGDYEKQQICNNQREIQRLERELEGFCSRYGLTQGPVGERLTAVCTKHDRYLPLKQRKMDAQMRIGELEEEIGTLRAKIGELLSPYFEQIDSYEHCLAELQMKCETYHSLNEKKQQYACDLQENAQHRDELEREISDFLSEFYGEVSADEFRVYLGRLRRESEAYTSASAKAEQLKRVAGEREEKYLVCAEKLAAFNQKYALQLSFESRTDVQNLRDQLTDYETLTMALSRAQKAVEEDYKEHAQQIDAPAIEQEVDVESLKIAEEVQKGKADDLAARILNKDQNIRILERKAESIPPKKDMLDRRKDEKQRDTDACRLLDVTMEMLSAAKEELNSSYLGDIKHHFTEYMRMMDNIEQQDIYLDTELKVRLERDGAARELDYFSVGQTDIVMLCMRLALVDALFKETKPFIVLDDPFVNLDDRHTEEALEMLKTLAKDRQIIYMVCNSSRSVK